MQHQQRPSNIQSQSNPSYIPSNSPRRRGPLLLQQPGSWLLRSHSPPRHYHRRSRQVHQLRQDSLPPRRVPAIGKPCMTDIYLHFTMRVFTYHGTPIHFPRRRGALRRWQHRRRPLPGGVTRRHIRVTQLPSAPKVGLIEPVLRRATAAVLVGAVSRMRLIALS